MKMLAISVGLALVVAACTSAPPEPTPPLPPSSIAPSDAAAMLDQLLPQIEAMDREVREAVAAIARECTQPHAHPLRCAQEPLPGSLRAVVTTQGDICRRMREDYNKVAKAVGRPEVVLRETRNSVDSNHPITCDGSM